MPLRPPPLRVLCPSLPVTHLSPMSINTLLHSSPNPLPSFRRIFPFKIKYQSLGLGLGLGLGFPVRSFSGVARTEVRAAKSLIEDEEELSEWVSGLRTNSFRAGAVTDDEEDGDRGLKGKLKGRRGREGNFGGNSDGYSDGEVANSGRFGRGGGRRGGFDGGHGSGSGSDRSSYNEGSRFGRGGRRGGFDGGRGGSDRSSYNEGSRFGRGGRRGGFDGGRGSDRSLYSEGSRFGGNDRRGGLSGNSRFGSREGEFGRGGGRGGGRSNSYDNAGSSRSGSGNSRFGDRESEFGRNGGRGGLRGNSYGNAGSSRGSSGSSRFEGGLDRGYGGREGGRGRDREFGGRTGGGRGDGRVSSRGGRSGGGRTAFVSDEEMVDEEEFGSYGAKKGKENEKAVSGFLDLMSDDDSDVDDDDDDDESEEEEVEASGRISFFANEGVKSSSAPSSTGTEDSYLSETRFDQCTVSPLSLKAIRDVGYEKMTMVQAATLPVILEGKDVMAKARTGTGKTVAFLLPSIEAVIKTPSTGRDDKRPPILVLVICPTRELASQAAAEAKTLLKYHPSLGVQVVIGGTRPAVEQKRMQANPCQILVATPGRLRDHLENTAGFATRLMGVKVLVLDEADHLLDMGFRKDIEKIVAAVPKQRQTLLFSATIPDEVRQICHIALKRDYEYINTVLEGSGETHSQVSQMHLVAPLENQFPLLYAILKDHIADDVNYKVLVFCTTAMVTRLVSDLLGELNLNVREIHSRKPQSYRTRVSDEFRKSKGLILVTSDVSARGVDYPDVSLVIQVGLPSDREQYIHRLGRTGRKGKEGQGILLLAPWEESFLNTIKDLPISKATPPMVDPDVRKKVGRALSKVEMKNKEAAYQAWLGYYNSHKLVGRDKTRLVELANEFSRSMGLDSPPAISKIVLGKMGLKNVPGLRTK
ncbi:DEAD-box ATP-dependent RNA helicase 31-like [Silene latifolia]|uniref:DEAD-box ATP-dependent RNA helicase 31-like n=1 Tax=Silene latifolia TaxID=37657 RepID=UPI003D7859C1